VQSVFSGGHAGCWSLAGRRSILDIEMKPRCFALGSMARRPTSVLPGLGRRRRGGSLVGLPRTRGFVALRMRVYDVVTGRGRAGAGRS
jgi:hypothetical protein